MSEAEIKFTALETNEIFEKEKRDSIIEQINSYFGNPEIFQHKSGNTNIGGQTKWIMEKKYVWKVNHLDIFLKNIPDEKKSPPTKDWNDIFKSRISLVYIVGLECKELPYFQLMIYVQLSLDSKIPIIVDSYRLITPFRIFLQNLNGLSNKVYEMDKIRPRFHTHHIYSSLASYRTGTAMLSKLIPMQQDDKKYKREPNNLSRSIRQLPGLSYFGLPTVLSAVNFDGGVLSFVTHHEQFGGGGELQSCGVVFTQELQVNVCIPEFERQGIEKDIQMFSPNVSSFFTVTGGINLHLFLTGLVTWLSYLEITRNEM